MQSSFEDDQDFFEEIFIRDVEKWFTADIACCDECHDDFLSDWPHADYADGFQFQRNSIDFGSFFSGGSLQDYFNEKQFFKMAANMQCPRCAAPLVGNIWAYNLPFDIPADFGYNLEKLSALSRKTPSLLLSNSFAKNVFELIHQIGSEAQPISIEFSLYRARNTKDFDSKANAKNKMSVDEHLRLTRHWCLKLTHPHLTIRLTKALLT